MKSSTDDGGNRVHLIRAGPAGNLCIPTLQFKMAETIVPVETVYFHLSK